MAKNKLKKHSLNADTGEISEIKQRGKKKKKNLKKYVFVSLVIVALFYGMIVPRITLFSHVNILTIESSDVKFDLYDFHFANYSEDPESGNKELTLEILLEIRNPYSDMGLIIPHLSVDINHFNKKVAKIWIADDVIVEPFKNDGSNAAKILPIYFSVFFGSENSSLPEFFNMMLDGNLAGLNFEADIGLGGYSILASTFIEELFGGSQDDSLLTNFDLSNILTGVMGDDNELDTNSMAKTDEYVFLKEDTNLIDIRILSNIENHSIFNNENVSMYFGLDAPFSSIHCINGSYGNNGTGDGVYNWNYWDGTIWKGLSGFDDTTNGFTKDGYLNFTIPSDWEKKTPSDFISGEYYLIQGNVNTLDSNVNETYKSYITMNVFETFIGNETIPSESENPTDPDIPPVEIVYPSLNEENTPEIKGILQSDDSIDEFLDNSGLDFEYFLFTYLLGSIENRSGFLYGLSEAYSTEGMEQTDDDYLEMESLEFDVLLDSVFYFLNSHDISTSEFLNICGFKWDEIFTYIGDNFGNYTVQNGVSTMTGLKFTSEFSQSETGNYFELYSLVSIIVVAIAIFGFMAVEIKRKESRIFYDNQITNKKSDLLKIDISKYKLEIEIKDEKKIRLSLELVGAITAIGMGVVILLVKMVIQPNINDSNIFMMIPSYLRSFFDNINDISVANPYNSFVILLISYLDFPSFMSWMIVSFVISYNRNKQFKNIEIRGTGIKTFKQGLKILKVIFVVFSFGLLISFGLQLIGIWNIVVISLVSYFSGGILMILTVFLSVYFWFGLTGAIIGDLVGMSLGRRKTKDDQVFAAAIPKESDDIEVEINISEGKTKKIKQKKKKKIKIVSDNDDWFNVANNSNEVSSDDIEQLPEQKLKDNLEIIDDDDWD